MEAIFLLRHLMVKYKEAHIDLHIVSIDLEKVYGRVPREVIKWVLESN